MVEGSESGKEGRKWPRLGALPLHPEEQSQSAPESRGLAEMFFTHLYGEEFAEIHTVV